jgi:hypothetical protein
LLELGADGIAMGAIEFIVLVVFLLILIKTRKD